MNTAVSLSSTDIVAKITAASRKANKGKTAPLPDPADPSLNDEERKEAKAAQDAIKSQIKLVEPEKPSASAMKEQDAKLDDVNVRLQVVTDKANLALRGSHNLIKLSTKYGYAKEDERFTMKHDALAQAVQTVEALQIAKARLNGLEKDAMMRVTSIFGFEPGYIKKAIAERKEPKQMVMEFIKNERREVDKIHEILEAKGIARKGDEDTKSSKKRKK